MNKKMRELKNQMAKLNEEARAFLDASEVDKANGKLVEIEQLKAQLEVEKRCYENEIANSTIEIDKAIDKEQKPNGFDVMAKVMRKKALTESENALITGGTNGENLLIPEDVDLAIRELRKEYKSAKSLVTVIPTQSLSGSFNFEKGVPTGLEDLTDGGDVAVGSDPQFEQKPFTIKFFGKLIPVSNILQGSEKAGLMSYLRKWFVKNAILTENKAIFNVLKAGKTPKALKGVLALKSSLNKELDPSVLIGARIVTNQTGFDILDSEVDKNGRPLLQINPTNATEKLLSGIPIEPFSDAELPNVSGKAPVFYGRTTDGAYLIEKTSLEFAVSDQYLFNKNQTVFRVIEGFDTIPADTTAYVYATLEPVTVAV